MIDFNESENYSGFHNTIKSKDIFNSHFSDQTKKTSNVNGLDDLSEDIRNQLGNINNFDSNENKSISSKKDTLKQ